MQQDMVKWKTASQTAITHTHAKFGDDRPSDLGDRFAKQKKIELLAATHNDGQHSCWAAIKTN